MGKLNRRAQRKEFVDKKLINRLRIFAVIFCIMLFISFYEIISSYLPVWMAIIGFVSGILLGIIIGRASNVIWHPEASKALVKMDVLSALILALYILFAIFRRQILSHWLHGQQLSGFVICLSAGIMLGRLLSIRRQVVTVLKEQNKY